MKKLEHIYSAQKIRGNGLIKYHLWIDKTGELYVQILENEESGTFSKFLFSVSKYAGNHKNDKAIDNLEGYDIEENTFTTVKDNNNSGFLKAALRNILPDN